MGPEIVVRQLRMLPGLGGIHRDPPLTLLIEFRPAVIARNNSSGLLGNHDSDLEPGGDVLRSRHGDEERMEVGAVTLAQQAGPARVAPTPARDRLIVGHDLSDLIGNSPPLRPPPGAARPPPPGPRP